MINHTQSAYRIMQTETYEQDDAHFTSVTVLLSKARRLQEGHLSVCIQVFLVATKDNNDVGARQSPCVRQPVG